MTALLFEEQLSLIVPWQGTLPTLDNCYYDVLATGIWNRYLHFPVWQWQDSVGLARY